MIQDPQNSFNRGMLNAVVKGRCCVKKDHGRTVNTDADDMPGITVNPCKCGQNAQRGNRQYDTDPVCNAVRNLFAETIAVETRFHMCCFLIPINLIKIRHRS